MRMQQIRMYKGLCYGDYRCKYNVIKAETVRAAVIKVNITETKIYHLIISCNAKYNSKALISKNVYRI